MNESQSLNNEQIITLREVCRIPILSWNLHNHNIELKLDTLNYLCDFGYHSIVYC